MKLHLIFPYAASYRQPIYKLLDQNFDCEFHFCCNTDSTLKQMDYSSLKNCKFDLKEKTIHGQWKLFKGLLSIPIQKGDIVLMPGNVRYISLWFLLLKNKFLRKGIRIIPWTHGGYGRESKLQFGIKKVFFRLCDHILLYGEFAKRVFIEHGIANENKITIIWNSLDYDKQKSYRTVDCNNLINEYFQNNNRTIIFIGRITSEKKLDMIVDALRILDSKGERYNAVFIGHGESLEQLKTMVSNYNMKDRVWFYGPCYSDDEMYPLLKYADLCVSPGNVGLTAIHALTYGIPVITHNNLSFQGPEFESIKEGISGSFFKQNDLESMVNCISNWFKNSPEREIVRINCYRVIDTYFNPYTQLEIIKAML